VVRGAIADLGRVHAVRRLLHPDDSDPASLIDVPRRWLALDVDGLARPATVAAEDIPACAEVAIAQLPGEFSGVRCIAQATASHGFKPGIRLRLWYWLDRPVCGAELKRWLLSRPVDHSLFGAAQVIYTAAPIFEDHHDPLPTRMIRLQGAAQVVVPALPQPERQADPKPVKPATGLSRYGEAGLDNACTRIIAAGMDDQNKTLNRESYSIGRLAGAGAVPAAFARAVLLHAGPKVPTLDPKRPWLQREIEKTVNRAFDAGMRRPRETRHG
jgi:hypothetical protein